MLESSLDSHATRTRNHVRRLFAVLIALVVASLAIAANDPVITVQISANRVTATGVTPKGDVVFFGRSAGWKGGMRHLQRHAVILNDEDRDGVVTLTLNENVPPFSTFVIVDLDSGASAIASPPGFTPRRIDLPAVVWRGGVSYIDVSSDYLDVLFVRPRVGVWRAEMWQGGSRDADHRNDANLRAALASMKPLVGSSPPPPTATPRDVIVIIDPRRMDVFTRKAD